MLMKSPWIVLGSEHLSINSSLNMDDFVLSMHKASYCMLYFPLKFLCFDQDLLSLTFKQFLL